jgi:hypothetical protein
MNAKLSRRTTVIIVGLVSALLFAIYFRSSEQDVGPSIAMLQTASAEQKDTAKALQAMKTGADIALR